MISIQQMSSPVDFSVLQSLDSLLDSRAAVWDYRLTRPSHHVEEVLEYSLNAVSRFRITKTDPVNQQSSCTVQTWYYASYPLFWLSGSPLLKLSQFDVWLFTNEVVCEVHSDESAVIQVLLFHAGWYIQTELWEISHLFDRIRLKDHLPLLLKIG